MTLDNISFFVGIGAGLAITYIYKLIELDILETRLQWRKKEREAIQKKSPRQSNTGQYAARQTKKVKRE